jgi:hypothetical protein
MPNGGTCGFFAGRVILARPGSLVSGAWSLVHGFTMLLLDGRLSDILRRLPAGTDAETLLDAMLKVTIVRPPKS